MLNFSEEKYLKVTEGAINLRNEVEQHVDAIYEKGFRNIFLLGSGGSIAILQPFEYMLNSISTIPAYAEIASEFIVQNHKQFDEQSLVIVSSLSGSTEETIAAVEYCKEKGATTIGLAGEWNTPLSNLADYVLVNYAENDFAADSINLQLYMLIFRIMYKNNEFAQYQAFVDELKGAPHMLLEVKKQTDQKAKAFSEKYKDEKYHMLVGAGTSWGRTYAYAMCVLEEMQWIHAKSIHAAEFFHGTIEIVEEDTSIILLKSEDETRPLIERVERFAEKYTNKLTVFDTKDYELNGLSEEFRKYMAPIVLATALQRVSIHLENQRGHSLEKRRYYRTVAY